jgi:hypothetical protein
MSLAAVRRDRMPNGYLRAHLDMARRPFDWQSEHQ